MDYCRIPNYKFGYDHLFRTYLSLPQAEINFISPKVVDHSIIVSVARHGKLPVYATLFWKAIQILGRDSSLQSRKALIEKNFKSEMAFREILLNATNEVNVRNLIHNSYIVSERFHLMLIWYIYNGFSDSEMKYVHQRLINHVKYLEKIIAREELVFDENEIDNAEMKGGILSQLFPKKSLYWVVYPMSKNCEYLAAQSIRETIAHFYVYKFGRNSKEGDRYWDQMSEAYKATFFTTASVEEEEPESNFPEMSDIPETAKIVFPPIVPVIPLPAPQKQQQPFAVQHIPSPPPQPQQQQPIRNMQKEKIIELSERMEIMYEKYQKPGQQKIKWVELIKACPTDTSNMHFPSISEDLREQYIELSKKMQAHIAYLKEKMRRPRQIVNHTKSVRNSKVILFKKSNNRF